MPPSKHTCCAILAILVAATPLGNGSVAAADGVLARCGASKGRGYFLKDNLSNPDGPMWADDGISSGKVVLIRLGDEWDIQFDDTVGAYGYRQDGATVAMLGQFGERLSIGAFRGTYADIFTFDFAEKEVVWTSQKIGTFVPKVAVYVAKCEIVNRP
ncbi:hypothetical protein L2U69_11780 [Zavarzinia compransoris]|uniref:hypothetical protein n=1 Tax=Zavarzinia marina TaxID=2911065 RepID=UPI001F43A216|nr:hypothetical protein [Zavarzinia marina]MCF4166326.1 hypothetical protein [Zavarzinia marina]